MLQKYIKLISWDKKKKKKSEMIISMPMLFGFLSETELSFYKNTLKINR
jgi:hypothetical protein